MNDLLTVKEVAEMLRVTVRGVQAWIREGELTAFKLGREYRIKQADVDVFLEKRKNV